MSERDVTPVVLGLVALLVAVPFPPAAIVVGGLGVAAARGSGQSTTFPRIGMVLGIILTAIALVLLVLAVVFGLDAFTVLYRQCEQLGQESGSYGPFPYTCD